MTEREYVEPPLVYTEVEVFGPDEDPRDAQQADYLASSAELLDMLVSRFEDSLVNQEREMSALRRSLEEAQESAAADRAELETVQQVCRILERENARMGAEVEELRRQLGDVEALRRQVAEAEELREQVATLKKRRRIAQELDELRKQVSELSFSSDRVLEQLLGQQSYS
jgi:chromosome segregation ATPase